MWILIFVSFQTFNFIPELQTIYDEAAKNQIYEKAQHIITQKKEYEFVGKTHLLISRLFCLSNFNQSFQSFKRKPGYQKKKLKTNIGVKLKNAEKNRFHLKIQIQTFLHNIYWQVFEYFFIYFKRLSSKTRLDCLSLKFLIKSEWND